MRTVSTLSRRSFVSRSAATAFGVALSGLVGSRLIASAQTLPPSPEKRNVPPLLDLPRPNGQPDEAFWAKVRGQFDLLPDLAFLNNGTVGPVPRHVSAEHERWDNELFRDPRNSFRQVELDEVREKIAAFVNADPDEIALTHSTTEGVNIFAHGLDLKAGDEVVLGSQEHHAAIDAYAGIEKRYGIKVVTAELPAPPESVAEVIKAYENAITPRTRVIVVSQVTYVSGLLAPVKELAELAHRRGLLISVDAAQSFGVIPLDLRALGVDHYAAPGQKWLLAGTGTGFSYFKKDIQDRIWPLTGFYNLESKVPHANSARRYEHNGQINIGAALGIGAAVEFHQAIGPINIEKRDRELAAQLQQGLGKIAGVKLYTSADPALSASLTAFAVRGLSPEETAQVLHEKYQVFIRTIKVGEVNGVRASTHFYNTAEEVDRLVSAVRKLV
jgi:selenocysteine lyase/cysteine desulfurase